MSPARPLVLLASLLGASEALQSCHTRLISSRVAATPRAAWALTMCDAAEEAPDVAPADDEATQARKPRAKKLPIEELEVGSMVEGTVRSVQQYGAFIDIGYTTDGLLHVSEMADTFVKDANDMFSQGDAVTVRVKSVDLEKQQVALSNKDPNVKPTGGARRGGRQERESVDLSEFKNANEKEFITGTVRSIQSFGAFVNLKEGVDGLLHISEIQEGGVKSVEDVLSEGQEVQVRVVSFDDKRRIGLSMKPYVELTEEEKAEKVAGRRPRRQRGGGLDDDAAFKMAPEEIAKLTLDFEEVPTSPFAAALTRAEEVKEAKATKKKYAPIVL